MAIPPIGLGSAPNDGNGDGLRTGGAKVNVGFLQTDTNQTNIATNTASIVTNAAAIKLIQSKSFTSPSTAQITNTSATVYVATDLLVAITPKSASSVLRINFAVPLSGASTQTGGRIKIQSNINSAGWVDILFGSQTETYMFRDSGATVNLRDPGVGFTKMDSPGIADEIEFRAVFAAFLDTVQISYVHDQGVRMITVDEILET